MCGICGFIDFKCSSNVEDLNSMVSVLSHRGPDDNGSDLYLLSGTLVGLGHSRLSILDLSPLGHQPMSFEHFSLVFNGEIYNFKEIRKDLIELGHKFKTESDTEVILHSFVEWGDSCIKKFIGMFAFVILNKKTLELTVVRDRAGVKPLFYYWKDDLFLFASELKSFHQHPKFLKKINEGAVHQYMDYGFVPSPFCIFESCNKLDPGHILKINIKRKTFEITKYWDVKDFYLLPKLTLSYSDAQDEVEKLLISAFEYRMVSDVPVGVFLSGGYDSSAVTAILQSNRMEKLKTFTIGFEEGNNEAPFAKEIAKFVGTDHTEYYCTTKEAQEIIPTLPYYYDEPFADSSAIPTILVSKLAKDKVTVALSADAGDEIFAGYTYYNTLQSNLELIERIPLHFRKTLSLLARTASYWGLKRNSKLNNKLDVFSKVLRLNKNEIPQALHKSYFALSRINKIGLFKNANKNDNTIFDTNFTAFRDAVSIALSIDYNFYLQNDILSKVDRAAMSVSLEGREPFLDHRLIEFVAQLPTEYKKGHTQKMILKDIVHKYIPQKLMDRPKSGFEIPINSWLKKEMSYLLEENLNSAQIVKQGLFQPEYVQQLKRNFYNGTLSDSTIIWKLLQFQMWYKKWM